MMAAAHQPPYQPSSTVLDHIRGVTLVAVVGPAGAGKTTLMNQATQQDPDIHFVLTDVSRAARPEERDGVDYSFKTRQEMQSLLQAGAYVQVAEHVSGDLYATRPESYSPDGINMMAILAAAIPDFRRLPFRAIRVIYIVPPDFATWQTRLQLHDFTEDQRRKRLREARRSFLFGLQDTTLQFVINADLHEAQADFMTFVHAEPPSARLQADQKRARMIIQTITAQLT